MDETHEGKRLAPSSGLGRRGKIILCAVGGFFLLLLAGYLALGAWFSASGRLLPGLEAGGIPIGNLTPQAAIQVLESGSTARYETLEIPITLGDTTQVLQASHAGAHFDVPAIVSLAQAYTAQGNLMTTGFRYLAGMFSPYQVECPVLFENPAYVDTLLDEICDGVNQPVTQSSYTVDDQAGTLTLLHGITGQTVVRQDLDALVHDALQLGDSTPIQVSPTLAMPAPFDFAALAQQLETQAANASLDPATGEILPHVVGLALDPAAAESRFSATSEGQSCIVPLAVTAPEITAEALQELLFRDVLGECKTSVGGSNNRASNVRLSAAACHNKILLPGGQLSYNTATGSRTAAAGYLPAPAYVGGKSVDEIGGGICQTSSTLYLATLRANLKIVERYNHMYAVGYVPDGMDATVYFGSLDFIFENNTPYPIKVVATMEGRSLTVRIYGTKTDDNYVVMENKRLSTTPYATLYEPGPAVPQGTTQVSVTPYTGRRVEAYRCIYQGDGTLISRTLESTNTYKHRNKLILYNPADGDPSLINPPPVTGAPPPVTDAPPPVTGAPPPVTDAPPPVTDAPPPVTDAPPPVTDAPPTTATPVPEATPAPTPMPEPPPPTDAPPEGVVID